MFIQMTVYRVRSLKFVEILLSNKISSPPPRVVASNSVQSSRLLTWRGRALRGRSPRWRSVWWWRADKLCAWAPSGRWWSGTWGRCGCTSWSPGSSWPGSSRSRSRRGSRRWPTSSPWRRPHWWPLSWPDGSSSGRTQTVPCRWTRQFASRCWLQPVWALGGPGEPRASRALPLEEEGGGEQTSPRCMTEARHYPSDRSSSSITGSVESSRHLVTGTIVG